MECHSNRVFAGCILAITIVFMATAGGGVEGAVSESSLTAITNINARGPYVGLVVPNAYEMNPLLVSSSFVPHRSFPRLYLFGRRFRIGTVGNTKVIVVMTGLSMLNAGVTTQLLLTLFDVKGVVHYGNAGNANPNFQIGDVTIPKFWAHASLWNWQRFGDGPEDELAFEADGDYTRSIGYLNFSDYSQVSNSSSKNNLLNSIWYQPEEVFPVTGTPEVRQHAFWVPVSKKYLKLAKNLEDIKLEKCVNTTTCLPRNPIVKSVDRGLSANVLLDNGDETGEKRKVRGVVNGSTLASYKQTHNKVLPIKVEFLPSGIGPAMEAVGSLIIHEIGSAMKDKVPMIASSFRKLVEQDRRIVFDHLRPNFVIEKEDDQLWNYIFKKACERYRDWKSNCKAFYKEHGPDVTPREFLDRRDQCDWLKRHFEEPTNKERGNKMSDVRNDPNRLNHRAGKRAFHARAAALAAKGDKAHFIATFSQVYSGDPKGAALAEKMQSMVRQALADQNGDESEHSILDDHEPLPVRTQIDIMSQVVGQTRGTYVTGTGKAFKRPPLPRGGPRNSHLKEQLEKQKDEFQEMKAAFEERIRVLEDLVVRGGSANLASQNASEGATSYGPDADTRN